MREQNDVRIRPVFDLTLRRLHDQEKSIIAKIRNINELIAHPVSGNAGRGSTARLRHNREREFENIEEVHKEMKARIIELANSFNEVPVEQKPHKRKLSIPK